MTRPNIVERVISWNEKRFKQEFNYPLECQLLLEETDELFRAFTLVQKMDAIGDITFVAIGTMWKLGIPTDVITNIFYRADLTNMSLLELNGWGNSCKEYLIDTVDHSIPAAWTGITLAIDLTLITAIGTLRSTGLQSYFYDIVEAICDSNDTKVVKGIGASDKKANIDKGNTYKPPDERLLKIAEKLMAGRAKDGQVN